MNPRLYLYRPRHGEPDMERCRYAVWDGRFGHHQCSRKKTTTYAHPDHGPVQLCAQHHPEIETAGQRNARKQREANEAARVKRHAVVRARDALLKAAMAWHRDPGGDGIAERLHAACDSLAAANHG